jgi:hypothetical protein
MSDQAPEIPPPPRTPRLDFRAGTWRASIPSAVVIALITTMGTTVAQAFVSASEANEIRAQLGRIETRLESLERSRQYAANVPAKR